jgi:hypothetical protein
MSEYLKYAILMSRLALVFGMFIILDFNLPYQVTEQEVIQTVSKREYRGGRSVQLQFQGGESLNVNSRTAMEFSRGSKLLMHKTILFDVPVLMENETTHFKTNIPLSVYGNFIFAPLILLITSLIGSFYWKGIEFRFNLGVVNFFLMLLTLLFLRIHLI